jgi:ABC-type antimicrobial peptide transport system permease subunit
MGGFKCFGKDLRETKLLLGLISVVAILLMAILGPFFAPYDPNDRSLVERR